MHIGMLVMVIEKSNIGNKILNYLNVNYIFCNTNISRIRHHNYIQLVYSLYTYYLIKIHKQDFCLKKKKVYFFHKVPYKLCYELYIIIYTQVFLEYFELSKFNKIIFNFNSDCLHCRYMIIDLLKIRK